MTTLALLHQLHELGVILTPSPDGTVRCRAPKGVLTPAIVDAMRQHKPELHALVEAFEERAAIVEYGAGLSRADAEALAWTSVLQQAAVPVEEVMACDPPLVFPSIERATDRGAVANRSVGDTQHVQHVRHVRRGTLQRLQEVQP